MQRLIEDLGRIISESATRKNPKRRVKSKDGNKREFARNVTVALKKRLPEIERLLPKSWELSTPLLFDKQSVEKYGDVFFKAKIKIDHGYPIDESGNEEAYGDLGVEIYTYNGGNNVVVNAGVVDFDPDANEVEIVVEWKRGKKAFNVEKDLWPLIKRAMKGLDKKMPNYEEYDEREHSEYRG